MINYKQNTETQTITSFQRAHIVQLLNPHNGLVSARFIEEIIDTDTNGVITKKNVPGILVDTMTDPAKSFPILDPTTGSVVGEATYGQLFAIVYSLYFDLAQKRDAVL